jgi:hypothetical protein
MGEMHARAALPQRTRNVRHRFVASRGHDLQASPWSEYIVFRPPSAQSPIPGGEHAIRAANIGKWQRKGVTRAKSSHSRSWPARSRRWRRRARKPGAGSGRN